MDLAREATHLHAFNYNFRTTPGVSFPVPLYPLVSPAVLVRPAAAASLCACCGLLLSRGVDACPVLRSHSLLFTFSPSSGHPSLIQVETFEAGTHISTYVARYDWVGGVCVGCGVRDSTRGLRKNLPILCRPSMR